MCVEHVDHIPGSIGNTTALRILKLQQNNADMACRYGILKVIEQPTWADKMKEDSFSALIDDNLFKIEREESTQKL